MTFAAAEIIDYGQTKYIFHDSGYYEKNSVIRKFYEQGGDLGITGYFVGYVGGVYLVADRLPDKYRKIFLLGMSAIRINAVNNNYQIGIKIKY